VGFSVERAYLSKTRKFDLPVVALENAVSQFDPAKTEAACRDHVDASEQGGASGYTLANFISPHAMVWRRATLGSSVVVFEDSVAQHGVQIA